MTPPSEPMTVAGALAAAEQAEQHVLDLEQSIAQGDTTLGPAELAEAIAAARYCRLQVPAAEKAERERTEQARVDALAALAREHRRLTPPDLAALDAAVLEAQQARTTAVETWNRRIGALQRAVLELHPPLAYDVEHSDAEQQGTPAAEHAAHGVSLERHGSAGIVIVDAHAYRGATVEHVGTRYPLVDPALDVQPDVETSLRLMREHYAEQDAVRERERMAGDEENRERVTAAAARRRADEEARLEGIATGATEPTVTAPARMGARS